MRTLSALRPLGLLLLLWGLPGRAGQPAKLKPDTQRGRELYQANCQTCHGPRGLGDGPASAALPSPPLAGRILPDQQTAAVEVILHGRGSMPAFSLLLPSADVRRVLLWLETLDPETGMSRVGEPPEETEDGGEGEEGTEEEGAGGGE